MKITVCFVFRNEKVKGSNKYYEPIELLKSQKKNLAAEGGEGRVIEIL
jgi:hypothetical protein